MLKSAVVMKDIGYIASCLDTVLQLYLLLTAFFGTGNIASINR